MKKNKHDNKESLLTPRAKKLLLLLLLVFLALPVWQAAPSVWYLISGRHEEAGKLASAIQMRDMIMASIDEVHADAPVDFKTGDIYFPEERLYLPRPANDQQLLELRYERMLDESSQGPILSITSEPVLASAAVNMYNARTVDEVFDRLPALQACSRGVQIAYGKLDGIDATLLSTAALSNGKTAFIYLDNGCKELTTIAKLLTQLQAY